MSRKVKVGVVGCGNVFHQYMDGCKNFGVIEFAACADAEGEKAKAVAEKHGIAKVCTIEELLDDDGIEIILNLTPPAAHFGISMAVLEAGKHVYSEKPLTIEREDGRKLLGAAKAKGLRVGCAPDTFLGASMQTCRKLIDEELIGRAVSACAFMMQHGPEGWHPSPEFFYKYGAGPMFDVGVYYVTTMVSLFGPVRNICAMTAKAFDERVIGSGPLKDNKIKVEVPTHVAGVMTFESGLVATIVTSFDVWHNTLTPMEIYGTEGTISLSEPADFGGDMQIKKSADEDWSRVDLTHGNTECSRGIGLADMAHAIALGRQHRVNGEMAYHVLDVMHAFNDSAEKGATVELASKCDRPEPMSAGTADGVFE